MRYVKLHENEKVPVFKNIAYALKLVWKADKKLFLSYMVSYLADNIFMRYIQGVLFLKVLLGVIDSGGDFNLFLRDLLLFFGVTVFIKVVTWWSSYIRQVSTKRVLKVLNNMVFEKAISLDVAEYEEPKFYDKYQRATLVMSAGYYDVLCSDFADVVSSVLSLIFLLGTVASIGPVYLLFLIPTLFVFVIELRKSKKVYKRDWEMAGNNRTKAYIQRTVFLKDFSKDMRTSNIFSVMMKRFDRAIKENVKILKSYGFKLFVYSMISTLFSEFIPLIGTYAYAAYQFVRKNTLSVSGFSVVISAFTSVRESISLITYCFDEMAQMALYFQNLHDFFDCETNIKDGEKTAGKFESLEFKNVTFRYPSAKKNVFENISFKITKGETIAIVGVNGAGKSTLVKLLLRFYDPTQGEILYNGVNIKEYTVDSLRNAFATVFQDYRNFAISIFENVICRECSDEDRERAKSALKKAGLWEKISSMPSGGETVLTREFDENGAGLSGGENQKLSTARLFAGEYEIAVLDEPSSALDPIAEYKMYESLIDATKDKTVIYISHRLSSAVLSDRIFVISNGRISESGTHKQLLGSDGEYSRMFKLQASGYVREEGENDA